MSSTRRSAPALAIAALLVASAFTDESAAQSGSKAACASAFEQAQQQRRNGSLMRARKHLTFCSQRACGAVAQRECTALLDQVEREMPSAVLSLEDEDPLLSPFDSTDMNGRPQPSSGSANMADPKRRMAAPAERELRPLRSYVLMIIQTICGSAP